MDMLRNTAILSTKMPLVSSVIAGVLAGVCLLGVITPQTTKADLTSTYCVLSSVVQAKKADVEKAVTQRMKVIITAYSSTPEETDDTPFITASGKTVRDGIVANNLLPLGTKIKIPGLYGDKVFTVEDRMNKRWSDYRFDIWFPSKTLAKNFGVKTAYIEVLEN